MYHFEKISLATEFSETSISKFLKSLPARDKTHQEKMSSNIFNSTMYIQTIFPRNFWHPIANKKGDTKYFSRRDYKMEAEFSEMKMNA